ncbi:formamidopyrimidine-DNA glycosylase [Aureococcus anophagefferens]|nr:formamidopyrimidine-DNA glycosylase [Aureococcus anophagefferens]
MSGGWTLRAGHPHARLALRLASDDGELVAYGTPDPRPKLRDLAPLGFAEVSASVAGDGRAVRRDAGPHGRTLHWVEEAQTGAMPDSDEAAAAARCATPRPRRWRGREAAQAACRERGLRVSGAKAGARRLTSGS